MSDSPMLMNPKYLKFCKYYKGEETIPFDKDFDTFTRFWMLERDYYTNVYERDHSYWECYGTSMCKEPPYLDKYISKITDKTIRGFVAWATISTISHNPSAGFRFITKYRFND